MKVIIAVAILTFSVFAQASVQCSPDGRGGFICRPIGGCMPGTVCSK